VTRSFRLGVYTSQGPKWVLLLAGPSGVGGMGGITLDGSTPRGGTDYVLELSTHDLMFLLEMAEKEDDRMRRAYAEKRGRE
jgi:hypothetical protein